MWQALPGTDREAVERADEVLRSFQGGAITDPTVFVKGAALGGVAAIELAKLAQSKSQSATVRSFAARVLKEQQAMQAELASVAKREKLDVPASLVYEDEQMVNAMAEKSGAQFDAAYAQQMSVEIARAIGLFESAAKMQDSRLAAFAKKSLPMLEEQQRLAADLTPASTP
jgi:putative membrane protein